MLARMMKRTRHGDDVTGDVAKTGDTFSIMIYRNAWMLIVYQWSSHRLINTYSSHV